MDLKAILFVVICFILYGCESSSEPFYEVQILSVIDGCDTLDCPNLKRIFDEAEYKYFGEGDIYYIKINLNLPDSVNMALNQYGHVMSQYYFVEFTDTGWCIVDFDALSYYRIEELVRSVRVSLIDAVQATRLPKIPSSFNGIMAIKPVDWFYNGEKPFESTYSFFQIEDGKIKNLHSVAQLELGPYKDRVSFNCKLCDTSKFGF